MVALPCEVCAAPHARYVFGPTRAYCAHAVCENHGIEDVTHTEYCTIVAWYAHPVEARA